ncbi:MAG: LuxR C-terminal-related transcriptional regulator [Gammaproteobacteria bacterium]
MDAAEGNFPAALKALDSVEAVLERDRSQWSVMGPSIGMLRTLYRLQSGQTALALRWAASREHSLLASRSFRLEEDRIVLARCLALQHRNDEALALLERIEADTARAGRLINQVKAMVARALVLAPQDLDAAADCLQQALQKAEEPGYRRVFLDEGDALHPLFRHLVARGHAGWWDSALPADSGASGLIEPLTARELEVLDMIAQGHRNQSIADALHIAVTTTKAHIRNIYEKMAVNSRTQAVARARELGLLP